MIFIQGKRRERLGQILNDWEGTPRMMGQKAKGAGADCVGFIVGVMQELVGNKMDNPPLADAFQVRSTTEQSFRAYLKAYPADVVEGEVVEPGDIIIVGTKIQPMKHAMIAGNRFLWHCGANVVERASFTLDGMRVNKILRYKDKGGW